MSLERSVAAGNRHDVGSRPDVSEPENPQLFAAAWFHRLPETCGLRGGPHPLDSRAAVLRWTP